MSSGITPVNTKTQPAWVQWQMAEWGYSALHSECPSSEHASSLQRAPAQAYTPYPLTRAVPNATTLMLDLFDDATGTLQHQIVLQRTFPRT